MKSRDDCPLCGERARRVHHVHGPEHVLSRCARCTFVYSSRFPAEEALAAFYGDGYYDRWSDDDAAEEKVRALKKTTFERWLAVLASLGARGRILDVGCAKGWFLEAATERGFEAWGVELSAEGAARARRGFRERVHQGRLEDAPFPPASFDAVTLLDVVEHVEDPLRLLGAVRRLLKPSGMLLLTTPDVSSLSAHLLGRRWVHYKRFEHLSFFDRGTLKGALRTAGFEPVRATHARKSVSLRFLAALASVGHGPVAAFLGAVDRLAPGWLLDRPFGLVHGEVCLVARAHRETA